MKTLLFFLMAGSVFLFTNWTAATTASAPQPTEKIEELAKGTTWLITTSGIAQPKGGCIPGDGFCKILRAMGTPPLRPVPPHKILVGANISNGYAVQLIFPRKGNYPDTWAKSILKEGKVTFDASFRSSFKYEGKTYQVNIKAGTYSLRDTKSGFLMDIKG